MSEAQRPPDLERTLQRVLLELGRVPVDAFAPTLKMTDGRALTSALRDELLAKCQAGEFVELDVDLLAYEQEPGKPNRNFVRFRDGAMTRFGASGKGRPFLRDHLQEDSLARGGVIVKSASEKVADGHYKIQQTARLTAPWMVDLALRDLLGGVSIGALATGPVECSVCGVPVFTKCYHFPGDKLTEEDDGGGSKRLARSRDGDITVEWIFTAAEMTETSICNIPAVPTAGVEGMRAMLSAALGIDPPEPGTPVQVAPEAPALSARNVTDVTEPIMPEPIAQPIAQTPAEIEAAKLVAEADLNRRVDEKVRLREANAKDIRRAGKGLALAEKDVEAVLAQHPDNLQSAKLALFDLVEKRQAANPLPQIELGEEQSEKKAKLVTDALVAKMARVKPQDVETARLARMSLMAIGAELFEDAGVTSHQLRDVDPQHLAKLMLGMPLPIGISRKFAGPGMNSTSDFPTIIGDALGTRMRQLYALRQQTWKMLAGKENLKSFDAVPTYIGGRFPDLLTVKEGGTYQRGSFQVSDMSVQLAKAGRIVSVTWELLLADRIGLIERAISDRVNAAIRWEDALFYAKLISGKMADGTTDIFTSANTATAGAISVTTLASAFVKMATRTAESGDPVVGPGEAGPPTVVAGAVPKFWLVPVVGSVTAEALLGDGYVPTASSGAPTRAMKALSVIGDGNLDANSITASYLFADPSVEPAVMYGHLESEDGPVLEEEDGFTVDGKDYKVRNTGYVEFVNDIGVVKMALS